MVSAKLVGGIIQEYRKNKEMSQEMLSGLVGLIYELWQMGYCSTSAVLILVFAILNTPLG